MNLEAGILAVAFGYVAQWIRGFERIPNQWSYVFIGIGGVLVYWLALGGNLATREFWWGAFTWMLAARGTASASSEARIAPKTNSLGPVPKGG